MARVAGREQADDGIRLGSGVPRPRPEQDDVADYIADFTEELGRMARRSRLDLLAYLLEVAHLEACSLKQARAASGREG